MPEADEFSETESPEDVSLDALKERFLVTDKPDEDLEVWRQAARQIKEETIISDIKQAKIEEQQRKIEHLEEVLLNVPRLKTWHIVVMCFSICYSLGATALAYALWRFIP